MKGVTAAQFDPGAKYPDGAWAHGPGDFYCATSRGHVRLVKGDWIVMLGTERIAVTDATYKQFFKRGKASGTNGR